ncbi:MAG: hypothetical protein F6J94_23840 [Moorea sp. SIO1F2]|uniref:hypothetical protein n=1 Tax=Moorena sp. SIO1F2 TaxID=2607819 RepID=UPI0013BE187F|nr:hypothetical protein [Moorena sp. SIO1F2]NET84837.1 hypothetical protein [Moorena sp. SIO1F2]
MKKVDQEIKIGGILPFFSFRESGVAKKQKARGKRRGNGSPYLSHLPHFPLFPDSRFPIPDSRFPIPDSRFPCLHLN